MVQGPPPAALPALEEEASFPPQRHRENLEKAGFVGVREKVYKAISHGSLAQRQKPERSRLESYSLALFSRVLGWSPEEIQVFLASVRKELQDPQTHIYGKFHVVWGRKPSE
ncbi:hypothetical protein FE257_007235 [Aspergillus nanangensis]|uniref:Uncharacterized protein n=1 Tax=Aspergillus nanangensis TaxID=2582783 RepID=A0AAD4GUC9_ASPNN|nr:hypothetical protein FE257_007235 [Aspergillus nanangensis]